MTAIQYLTEKQEAFAGEFDELMKDLGYEYSDHQIYISKERNEADDDTFAIQFSWEEQRFTWDITLKVMDFSSRQEETLCSDSIRVSSKEELKTAVKAISICDKFLLLSR